MKVETSVNYDKFKKLEFNRDIIETTVKKLVNLNRETNEFQYFPIVVNSNYEIIDGQHRYEACKILERPIYYLMKSDKRSTVEDVNRVNVAGRRHNLSTKLEMLGRAGDEVILELISIRDEINGAYGLSGVFNFSIMSIQSGVTTQKVLESGNLDICNIEHTRECLKYLLDSQIKDRKKERILFVVLSIAKKNKMPFKKVVDLLNKRHFMIETYPNKEFARKHFIEVINYNKKKGRLV